LEKESKRLQELTFSRGVLAEKKDVPEEPLRPHAGSVDCFFWSGVRIVVGLYQRKEFAWRHCAACCRHFLLQIYLLHELIVSCEVSHSVR
jgi:hypothetical protein